MVFDGLINKAERTKIKFKSARSGGDVVASLTSLAFSAGQSNADEIVVDAVISRTHERSARVTRFKVEEGSDLTDHVVTNPKTLRMDCFISAEPSNNLINNALEIGASIIEDFDFNDIGGSLLSGIADGVGDILNRGDRYTQVFERLEKAWLNAEELIIETARTNYESMIITGYNITDSTATGKSLVFSLDLMEIRKVTIQAGAFGGILGNLTDFGLSLLPGADSALDAIQGLQDSFTNTNFLGTAAKLLPTEKESGLFGDVTNILDNFS